MLEERLFKIARDSKKRLSITALLTWQSNFSQTLLLSRDASPASIQSTSKKKTIKKKDKVIKKEIIVTEKRSISAGFIEFITAAKRLLLRRYNDYFLKKAKEKALVK
jgi:hypothetical protein